MTGEADWEAKSCYIKWVRPLLRPPPLPCHFNLSSIRNNDVFFLSCSLIRYLIWISIEIKILQKSSSKFTKQEVVGLVDCPQAPVRVVVGAGTGTERAHCKLKSCKDMSYTLLSLALFMMPFCLWCLLVDSYSPSHSWALKYRMPSGTSFLFCAHLIWQGASPGFSGNIPDNEILLVIVSFTTSSLRLLLAVGFLFNLVVFCARITLTLKQIIYYFWNRLVTSFLALATELRLVTSTSPA